MAPIADQNAPQQDVLSAQFPEQQVVGDVAVDQKSGDTAPQVLSNGLPNPVVTDEKQNVPQLNADLGEIAQQQVPEAPVVDQKPPETVSQAPPNVQPDEALANAGQNVPQVPPVATGLGPQAPPVAEQPQAGLVPAVPPIPPATGPQQPEQNPPVIAPQVTLSPQARPTQSTQGNASQYRSASQSVTPHIASIAVSHSTLNASVFNLFSSFNASLGGSLRNKTSALQPSHVVGIPSRVSTFATPTLSPSVGSLMPIHPTAILLSVTSTDIGVTPASTSKATQDFQSTAPTSTQGDIRPADFAGKSPYV